MSEYINAAAEDFSRMIKALKLEDTPELWREYFENAQLEFPCDGLGFLNHEYLLKYNSLLRLPEDVVNAFIQAFETIHSNEYLLRLTWLCHYILFHSKAVFPRDDLVRWPVPESIMGQNSGMFPAVILLSGMSELSQLHQRRGIPEEIIQSTLSDLLLWMNHYHDKFGVWGLEQLAWFMNYFSGEMYRLGRLQFIPSSFSGNLIILRGKVSGKVIALSEAGIKYRGDGQRDGTNGIYDTLNSWISYIEITPNQITGNPILPSGSALKETISLSTSQWEKVLSHGDAILEVHIPAGSKMEYAECGESFKTAVAFFERYFPEVSFKGFTCSSWLLDSQLQGILDPSSNIYKFQREFYLFPLLTDDFQTFERVFGSKPVDFPKAPRDTSLKRAILDYVIRGNHMRAGGGFILKDDLNWGGEIYQNK
jgi:hypothetical protein